MALKLQVSSKLSEWETNSYYLLCDLQRVKFKVNWEQEELQGLFMFLCSSPNGGARNLECKRVSTQQVDSPFGVCEWEPEPQSLNLS